MATSIIMPKHVGVSLTHSAKQHFVMSMSVIDVGDRPSHWDGGTESHSIRFHDFESLPAEKGNMVTSPTFNSLGSEWTVVLDPGGHTTVGNISLFLRKCSGTEISVHFEIAIKTVWGDYKACRTSHTFKQGGSGCGWYGVASRAKIMKNNVLQHGSLIVEVRMRPKHCKQFIPKNPFKDFMPQLFSDEETMDISFRVEVADTSESSSTALGEVFNAHRLVLKTCAKGSVLASLCEINDNGFGPVPIKDVDPKVFHLLLRYIYGGVITSAEWKDHGTDLIDASDKYGLTNLKIEAESWYVNLIKFSVDNVVEAVSYADRMNCFLLKEAAVDFILANLDGVLSSGTLKNIPDKNDVMHDILVSVAKGNKKGQKRKHDGDDDLDTLSINDLRAQLAWVGKDFDGPRATLIARLKSGMGTK